MYKRSGRYQSASLSARNQAAVLQFIETARISPAAGRFRLTAYCFAHLLLCTSVASVFFVIIVQRDLI